MLPKDFVDKIEVCRMINSGIINLDLLDQYSLSIFVAFLKNLLARYENDEPMETEDYRQDYIEFLRRFIELVSLPI